MALPVGDPAFLGLLALLVAFFFFVYLLLRRTLLAFREGTGRDRR